MPLLEQAKKCGMPLVLSFFSLKENVFLNTAHAEAKGLEALSNAVLTPYHYLFAGKKITIVNGKTVKQTLCHYPDPLTIELVKTAAAIAALPFSLVIGIALKSSSFLSSNTRQHHYAILSAMRSIPSIKDSTAFFSQQQAQRTIHRVPRPSHEPTLKQKKELSPLLNNVSAAQQKEIAALPTALSKDILALKDLGALLDAYRIPWWVDCGTLLGVYRHEGIIPWDHDIDVAVLQEQHDTVLSLMQLPAFAKKYRIMDWSPADEPKSLLKLYVKETGSLIDIYHYRIDKDTITYLSPYYAKWYMPHFLKIREEFWKVTQPLSVVFPLQTAQFDGVAVHVPQQYEVHLKGIYQGDLRPAKIWDGRKYKNVPGHPYWEKA
jgi:hypothetical protein